MLFQQYPPCLELAPYVQSYLRIKTTVALPTEPAIPDGYVKLYLFLNDARPHYALDGGEVPCWSHGFGGHPLALDITMAVPAGMDVIICTFFPTGFYRLLRTPVTLLNNSVVDAEALLGAAFKSLLGELCDAECREKERQILDRFFTALLRRKRVPDAGPARKAEAALLANGGSLTMDALAKKAPSSLRTLERGFKEQVGMSPKHYARILRLNKVFLLKRKRPHISGAALAYACGYADQAHFAREFKAFLRQSPLAYFREGDKVNLQYLGRLEE